MRCLLISIIVFFLSCNKQDFCDQDSYPPPPFGNSDDTTFGKTFVQYSYTCLMEQMLIEYIPILCLKIVGPCK